MGSEASRVELPVRGGAPNDNLLPMKRSPNDIPNLSYSYLLARVQDLRRSSVNTGDIVTYSRFENDQYWFNSEERCS